MCEARSYKYDCGCKKTKITLCLTAYHQQHQKPRRQKQKPQPCPEEKQVKFQLVPYTKCSKCLLEDQSRRVGEAGNVGALVMGQQAVVNDDQVEVRRDKLTTISKGAGGEHGLRGRKDGKENRKGVFDGDDLISFEDELVGGGTDVVETGRCEEVGGSEMRRGNADAEILRNTFESTEGFEGDDLISFK